MTPHPFGRWWLHIIKGAGYSVIEAAEGMEMARMKTVNLVLTDQNMPHIDGLALIKKLSALPAYRTSG
ncbi:MAG: response regulator [Candidatus Nitrotoga sp.]